MDFLTILRGALTPRNLAKGALFFLLPALLLVGCAKNDSPSVSELVEVDATAASTSGDVASLLEKDVPALLADDLDKENNMVNQALLLFAYAVREAVADPSMHAMLTVALEADEMGFGVSIPELARENVAFSQLVGRVIGERLNLAPDMARVVDGMSGQRLIDAVASEMVKSGISYRPVIHQHKRPGVAPRTQSTIVAIAEGVNDDDDVVAYLDGSSTPFLMSEEYANASPAQIIFVANGEEPPAENEMVVPVDGYAISTDVDFMEERTSRDFSVERFRINNGFHFESNGNNRKSEIRGWRVIFVPSQFSSSPEGWSGFQSKRITRADINISKMHTGPWHVFAMSTFLFDQGAGLFIGAYEYDWYASKKALVNSCLSQTVAVEVRMKFSHEWYFRDCGQANQLWSSVNSVRTIQNQKCLFEIRRTL